MSQAPKSKDRQAMIDAANQRIAERKKVANAIKKKQAITAANEWYNVNSILGNQWAYFYILIGGREAGKSYSVMEYCIRQWKKKHKPFTWLRLTEASQKKLLSNKADKFVDADIRRKYDLDLTVKGNQVFDHGQPMAQILALSTFYSDKGVALFDNEYDLGYNIVLDEMNREKQEKRTFDIGYAFINQMENLVRSTKENLRIFLIGNTLEEASDIMCLFNFIPEEFGRYYVKTKKAVIDYIKPSEQYLRRRQGTVADLLGSDLSTFTNKIESDKSLIYKGALHKPQAVIAFTKQEKYTIWDNGVIKEYNNEKKQVIPMRPYLDTVYSTDQRDQIFALYNARSFKFRDLITYKKFTKALELLKSR